ncbi:outer membrane protein assembly factor BamC [Comamonas aquatica]|uniref:outer membrane protein assembly factor BamC n=1 Tax=Comamonas aquatica TaxID=225991 RepID=UPI00244BBCAD|nr:outer membrane protein assembly factor BamC [Comamonas aquatica]MDH0202339.1 outer membrane protein assembly factor BamC [Comamonas aquatica]MDH0382631.1 outer membrane protein assembly factor BamC [Comamonas aquatica]MDH0428165.1 outer membrane protein assembly factor BamC [Comamonas aquatica]MDH0899596.1 outer membrane protein assembly factor BamC [Comamonas aquatica]MDH0940286.1 outer membrane protein assembly factor BamC [Comamonas aquatica]
MTQHTVRLSLIGLAVALSACSVIEEGKIDYKSAKKGSTLEVPPDLTQLTKDTRYTASPDRSVSAVALQAGQAQVPTVERAAPLQVGDVEIMRDGDKRWLVVNRPVDQLWEPTREFWLDHGFNLAQEKSDLGIIETEWAENRAKLPQDIIRSTLGKVFDSLYSTSERDRFRTRLERRADGKTEIYITHRGMEEVYSNTNKDSTIWQPRPADPELETEFLRRLMIKLGTSEEQSRALVASNKAVAAQPTAAAQIATVNGLPALQLSEPFDRAWRRVGVALDRTGFTVEDRDRSKGLYFVRYVPPSADSTEKKKGWFSGWFSSKPENKPGQYQIAVRTAGEKTQVTVLDAKGQPETTQAAQRIVRVIADDLK